MISLHRKLEATAEFSCSPEVLFEILIDYDSYKEWMPQVGASTLLAKAGELAIARLEWSPAEHGAATAECIHTTNAGVLSRMIEGESPIASLEWELAENASKGCQVRLILEKVAGLHPGFSELLSPEKILGGLQAYAAAFSPELVLEGEAGEVILEIFESAEGFSCLFNGQRYEMRPASDKAR